MISPKNPKTIPTPSSDLVAQLKQLGLLLTADSLDDLVARAADLRFEIVSTTALNAIPWS